MRNVTIKILRKIPPLEEIAFTNCIDGHVQTRLDGAQISCESPANNAREAQCSIAVSGQ